MNPSPNRYRSWTLPLCGACALALATAGAEPLPQSTLAGEDIGTASEPRSRTVHTRNRDDALVNQSADIIENAQAIAGEVAARSEAVREQAADAWGDTLRALVEESGARADRRLAGLAREDSEIGQSLRAGMPVEADGFQEPAPAAYHLYVSQSMGDGALRTAFELASQREDMVLVFRGLKRGQTFPDLLRLAARLMGEDRLRDGSAIPRLMIDPTEFEAHSVSVVPTLIRFDADGQVIAQARGVANPRWLDDQIAAGRTGDLGSAGTTGTIDEVNMIVLLQEAFARVDVEAYIRRQADTFWTARTWTTRPPAPVDRTREVDLTVILTRDILLPDGTVLGVKGQRINPMDEMPFTMTLIVFNGHDPAQRAWLQQEITAREGQELVLVTSELPEGENGWESYGTLLDEAGRMVYLLAPDLAGRFQIEHLPSVVEGGTGAAGEPVLLVHEIALNPSAASAASIVPAEAARHADPDPRHR